MSDTTKDALSENIIALIKKHADLKGSSISSDTELDTLGIHSLELTEIIMDIEEEYDIEIDLSTVDAWETMKTVGDIVEAVQGLIAGKA